MAHKSSYGFKSSKGKKSVTKTRKGKKGTVKLNIRKK